MTFNHDIDAAPEEIEENFRLMRVGQLIDSELPSGGALLDIGCWAGGLALALPAKRRRFYTGVDIEPAAEAVSAARSAVPEGRFLVIPSAESLPFEAESFDMIALTEVLEHVPIGREAFLLAELARVLRPAGSIILTTPYDNILNPLDPVWFFGHRHYSVRALQRLAAAQGLAVRDVQFGGGIWSATDTLAFYVHKHVLRRRYERTAWLRSLVDREHKLSRRAFGSTNVWCRLVRSGTP